MNFTMLLRNKKLLKVDLSSRKKGEPVAGLEYRIYKKTH